MKICAVVVTYNGVKWIKACLNSLKKSSPRIKIIVIDNASTDLTTKVIKNNFPEVLLIEKEENIGFGKANNIGMSIALKENMDYAFLLNQDAEVYPDTISELIAVSEKSKSYGIISPVHLDGSGKQLDSSFLYYLNRNSNNGMISDLLLQKSLADIYDFNMVNAAAWLLPVHTLKTVGGFNPMFFLYGEDDNFCQRVIYHKLKIGVVPSVFVKHDSENNNKIHNKKGSKKYFERFLNHIRVRYGNVNTDDYRDLETLKKIYYRKALKSMVSLRLKDFGINVRKRRLIEKLEFENLVKNDRKPGANYLDWN